LAGDCPLTGGSRTESHLPFDRALNAGGDCQPSADEIGPSRVAYNAELASGVGE